VVSLKQNKALAKKGKNKFPLGFSLKILLKREGFNYLQKFG
jgi:hypothetical protein